MYTTSHSEGKSIRCVSFSILVHGALFASVAILPSQLKSLPQGTTESIEFTALEASKGQQVHSLNLAKKESDGARKKDLGDLTSEAIKQKDLTPPPQKKAKPDVSTTTTDALSQVTVKAARIEPKPTMEKSSEQGLTETPSARKAETELPKKNPEKTTTKDVAKNRPQKAPIQAAPKVEPLNNLPAVATLEEDSENVQLPQSKIEPLAAPGSKGVESLPDDFESSLTKELEKEVNTADDLAKNDIDLKETFLGGEEVESHRPGEEFSARDEQELEPRVGRPSAEYSNEPTAQSDQHFGVPKGTRSYLDLKQRPGNLPPQYPRVARRNGWQGQVRLIYYVTAQGTVDQVQVLQSSGYRPLDQEAVSAISRYRYVPGQQGWTAHPVNFTLQGPAQPEPARLRTLPR